MTIAEHVISKCGAGSFSAGVVEVAKWAGVHVSRVHRWTYPKEKGGTGGIIPSKHQPVILDRARRQGIDLTPADFFAPEKSRSKRPSAPPGIAAKRARAASAHG